MDYILKDKKSIFIDKKTKIGKNVIIYENNRIENACEIQDNVTIFPNCFISNTIIGKGAKIYSSIIDKSQVGACASIGPYTIIRRSEIGNRAKVGAFCEIKDAKIAEGHIIKTSACVSDNL